MHSFVPTYPVIAAHAQKSSSALFARLPGGTACVIVIDMKIIDSDGIDTYSAFSVLTS
jgi:hypothetical protein